MLPLCLLAFCLLFINSCSSGESKLEHSSDEASGKVLRYDDYDRDHWRPYDDRDSWDDRDNWDDRDKYDSREYWDRRDKWDRYGKFKCPSSYGAFPDTEDCSSYYVCVRGVGTRRRCRGKELFDKYKRKCLSKWVAICDKGDKVTPSTPKSTDTTPKEEKFDCPSVFGTYMHPKDCSKYYTCTIFIASVKTCPEGELFDGVKMQCREAKHVHCGSRNKPTVAGTTSPVTEPATATHTPEDRSSPSPTPVKTPRPATASPSPRPATASPSPRPATASPSPKPKPPPTPRPTTPKEITTPQPTIPEVNCEEDDLDCIITVTGERPKWFKCPEDLGSYPHPSSNRLFIFCINWKPSVKKCGQDLVYSPNLRTCIAP